MTLTTGPDSTGSNLTNVTVTEIPAKGTAYVILEFQEGTDQWIEHGERVSAPSAEAAIRKHVGQLIAGEDCTLVAVPERSWRPVKVSLETTTVVKLG